MNESRNIAALARALDARASRYLVKPAFGDTGLQIPFDVYDRGATTFKIRGGLSGALISIGGIWQTISAGTGIDFDSTITLTAAKYALVKVAIAAAYPGSTYACSLLLSDSNDNGGDISEGVAEIYVPICSCAWDTDHIVWSSSLQLHRGVIVLPTFGS
jgi:hypothetical protein